MSRIKHKLSESCLKDLFSVVKDSYNLRSQTGVGFLGTQKQQV